MEPATDEPLDDVSKGYRRGCGAISLVDDDLPCVVLEESDAQVEGTKSMPTQQPGVGPDLAWAVLSGSRPQISVKKFMN